MNADSECRNIAILSIVGALTDHLIERGVVGSEELARCIHQVASAHDRAGRSDVGDSIRWIIIALLDENILERMELSKNLNIH